MSKKLAPAGTNPLGLHSCSRQVSVMKLKQTTTQRGYGRSHGINRQRLLMHLHDGELCWWCGRPMAHDQALDADHVQAASKGGTQAGRLLHARCNRQRGDGSNDHRRPTLGVPGGFKPLPILMNDGSDKPKTAQVETVFPWAGFTPSQRE